MVDITITKIMPRPFDSRIVDTVISAAMRLTTGRSIKRSFEKTVATWDRKPRFEIETKVSEKNITLFVYPAGEHAKLYGLVSTGSPPHQIMPRRSGGKLQFQTGYVAKTSPGNIGSGPGRTFGAFVSPPVVHHPGFEGREFGEAIAQKHKAEFEKDMQDAMNEAAGKM